MTAYRLATGRYPPPTQKLEETGQGTRLISLPLVLPERWATLCPEMAALIRQMLSEEPAARGSAGEVAQVLERAAETAGPAADVPITRHSAQVPPERGAQAPALAAPARSVQAPPEPVHALTRSGRRHRWLHLLLMGALGLTAAVGILLAISSNWSGLSPSAENPSEVAQEEREGDKEDAGTSGLGDGGVPVAMSREKLVPVRSGIRVGVPKKPLVGQRLPPCERPLVEINGGCWIGPRDKVPPCGVNSYEWKSGCYWPMLEPQRPPTSDPP
jgi:hypothetical protein